MVLDFLIHDENGPGIYPPLERVPKTKPPKLTPREEIFSSARTAQLLKRMGDDDIPDIDDIFEDEKNVARDIFETGREPTRFEQTVPGTMLHLESLLSEYDKFLVADANQIRTYVTNRLVAETEDEDPKIRMKAYELLGKITEVGLFTEKREISINNKSTEELETMLTDKIDRLMSGTYTSKNVIDVESEAEDEDLASSMAAARDVSAEDIIKDL